MNREFPEPRRIRAYWVTANLFEVVMKESDSFLEIESEIPKTARFMYAVFDHERQSFYCMFEDESFSPVCDGCMIPIGKAIQITTREMTEFF